MTCEVMAAMTEVLLKSCCRMRPCHV